MDRISGLPQHISHHILCYLSQQEAVQTSVLSKSWRHLGITRPKMEFLEESFNGDNKQAFLSAIHSTLERYFRQTQNLPLHQFILRMWALDPDSISLLQNWIPILILSMGVNTFHLSFHSDQSDYFDLPFVVFQSKTLENLHLERCSLKTEFANLIRLQNLRLDRARISDETLQKILSSCPLIESVSLLGCTGLEAIDVKNHPCNLKHFAFNDYYEVDKKVDEHLSIEIDASSVETIRITGCPNWNREFNYFPKLESLFLNRVKLPSNLFGFFSSYYLPFLQRLTLDSCNGFQRCHLDLGGSVKYLIIRNLEKNVIQAEIIAPNIVEFVYEGEIPEMTISFNTVSPDWKSSVTLSSYSDFDNNAGSWLNKLSGLLDSLKESKITLTLLQHRRMNQPNNIHDVPSSLLLSDVDYRCIFQPIQVEQLSLRGYFSSSSFPAFLNCLFCVCRPRYIGQYSYSYTTTDWEKEDKELNESLLEFLKLERELRRCFWPEGLEDVRMIEASAENKKKHVVARFGLKWRPFR